MGVTKIKSVPQRIPVKITKKITKKKPGGELICKTFGVNGKVNFRVEKSLCSHSGGSPKILVFRGPGGFLGGGVPRITNIPPSFVMGDTISACDTPTLVA